MIKLRSFVRKWHVIRLILVIITSGIAILILLRSRGQILPQKTIIASSIPLGTYEQVITTIDNKIRVYHDELGFDLKLKSIQSNGSVATLRQLEEGKVDIGIVQGNSDITGKSGGVTLALYDEVYLFFTNRQEDDLATLIAARRSENGKLRLATLGSGSQTALDAGIILEFFGAGPDDYELVASNYPESRQRLQEKQVDAALFVTGLGQPIIRDLADEPGMKLLPLADQPLICRHFRGVEPFLLEPGAIERQIPNRPIATLSTPALLMAGPKVQKAVAGRLTTTLLAHRWEVEKEHPFLNIRPAPEAFASLLHPGSAAAFKPSTEGFMKTYSEHLKLGLAIPAAILALYTFLNSFRKDRKTMAATLADCEPGEC